MLGEKINRLRFRRLDSSGKVFCIIQAINRNAGFFRDNVDDLTGEFTARTADLVLENALDDRGDDPACQRCENGFHGQPPRRYAAAATRARMMPARTPAAFPFLGLSGALCGALGCDGAGVGLGASVAGFCAALTVYPATVSADPTATAYLAIRPARSTPFTI